MTSIPVVAAVTVPGWLVTLAVILPIVVVAGICLLKFSFCTNPNPTFHELPSDAQLPDAQKQAIANWEPPLTSPGNSKAAIIASTHVEFFVG